jgi:hypothetical protein
VVGRKFDSIETCSMKTILSFFKPVSKGLDWIRQGLVMFWRITKVGLFVASCLNWLHSWGKNSGWRGSRAGLKNLKDTPIKEYCRAAKQNAIAANSSNESRFQKNEKMFQQLEHNLVVRLGEYKVCLIVLAIAQVIFFIIVLFK